MTTQKVYIDGKREVTIVCLKCSKSKNVAVSAIGSVNKPLQAKCSCGFVFRVVFEKREYYRKRTCLLGYYSKSGFQGFLKEMVVENLSKTGLGFRAIGKDIREGDVLNVWFTLDNETKTQIMADVVVRNRTDGYIGAEFCSLNDHHRKELGFYLMA